MQDGRDKDLSEFCRRFWDLRTLHCLFFFSMNPPLYTCFSTALMADLGRQKPKKKETAVMCPSHSRAHSLHAGSLAEKTNSSPAEQPYGLPHSRLKRNFIMLKRPIMRDRQTGSPPLLFYKRIIPLFPYFFLRKPYTYMMSVSALASWR